MTQTVEVPVAEFKRNFRRYAGEVQKGRTIRVTSHGKAVGDFVPASLRGGASLPPPLGRGGFLSIVGLFADWAGIEEEMRSVVRSRKSARSRPDPDLDT